MPVDKNCGVQIERLRVCASKVNDAVGQFAGKRGAPAPIQVGVKMGPLNSTRTLQCKPLLGNKYIYRDLFIYIHIHVYVYVLNERRRQ